MLRILITIGPLATLKRSKFNRLLCVNTYARVFVLLLPTREKKQRIFRISGFYKTRLFFQVRYIAGLIITRHGEYAVTQLSLSNFIRETRKEHCAWKSLLVEK